jgi:hypothetical protein
MRLKVLYMILTLIIMTTMVACSNPGEVNSNITDSVSSTPKEAVPKSSLPEATPSLNNSTTQPVEIKPELVITGDVDLLPEGKEGKLREVFEQQFPLIWNRFGKGKMPKVTYKIDADYDKEGGIAYTQGKQVVLNPYWIKRHPNDIDCMTHELIHVAQGYSNYNDVWLIEGIADYGRNIFGVANSKAGWSLPKKYKDGSLKDGYRVTAAFLVWVETNYYNKMVDVLNILLKANKYSDSAWDKYTDKSLQELWKEYSGKDLTK